MAAMNRNGLGMAGVIAAICVMAGGPLGAAELPPVPADTRGDERANDGCRVAGNVHATGDHAAWLRNLRARVPWHR